MTWSKLHDACKHNDTRMILSLSLNDAKIDSYQTDDHKSTPLHLLCLHKPNLEALRSVICANRGAVSARDINGNTPLHLLCRHAEVDVELVNSLVTADLQCLSIANHHGYLPIHVACKYGPANLDVIELLAKMNPASLHAHVKIGERTKKSLASLSLSSSPTTVADHLIEYHRHAGLKNVDSLELRLQQDEEFLRDGAFPLHIAIANGATLRLVQLLAPEAHMLQCTDKYGRTPLHIAVMSESDLDVVRFLLSQYPGAAHFSDKMGNLPIHLAAKSQNANFTTLKAMLSEA